MLPLETPRVKVSIRFPMRQAAALWLIAIALVIGVVPLLAAWVVVHHPITIHVARHHPSRSGLRYEDVSFPSTDGLRLSGWYIPKEDARGIVILCHGAFTDRTDLMDLALDLNSAGFAILAFDFRQRGCSGRKINTIGREEVNDLLGAVAYLKAREELAEKPIGAIGASMGAAVAIMATARCADICAVVADSSYGRLDRAINQHLWVFFGPLKPLLAPLTLWHGKRMLGFDPSIVAPEESIPGISPRPVLLVHSRRDFLVWKSESERLFDAAGEPKELWLTPRGLHTKSRFAHPEQYRPKVVGFLRRALTAPGKEMAH